MTINNILLTLATISLLSTSNNSAVNEKRYQDFIEKQRIVQQIEDPSEKIIEYRKMRSKYKQYYHSPAFKEAFTEDEINKICRAVETETYGADFESKAHVAEVIYARLENEEFKGETIDEIIVKGQFVFWRKEISEDTRLAVEYAFYFPSEVDGALYFHAGKAKSSWFGHPYITTDSSGHNFYGTKGW